MYRFKEFKQITESMEIVESNFPIWVRMVVGGLVVKLRNINKKIESSDDPIEQNKLISQSKVATVIGAIEDPLRSEFEVQLACIEFQDTTTSCVRQGH